MKNKSCKGEETCFLNEKYAFIFVWCGLLDGTSIDDMYPEVLPLNPLPDVGETNTIDEPLDYEYPYEPMEPNQPVNLLDRGLAPDTTSTTSSTTTTTTTSMTTTKVSTTTSTTSTTVEETSAARLFGE